MNRTVPLGKDMGARRTGQPEGDWLDEAVAPGAGVSPPGRPDHTAEMKAIAAQLERLSGTAARDGADRGRAEAAPGRLDALRDAVAAIARRQADLDGPNGTAVEDPREPAPLPRGIERGSVGSAARPRSAGAGQEGPTPLPPVDVAPVPALSVPALSAAVVPARPSPASSAATSSAAASSAETVEPVPAPRAADLVAMAWPPAPREPAGFRRAGTDLSAEVSDTFARFSRDLRDAIHVTDARPKVEALGQEVRQIGRAVDGLGSGLPSADALARIGEQTREMRDLLKASTARSVPFDAVERQVASLEERLGRLAVPPAPAASAPPDFGRTMAEVRALLDGFNPGASLAALETRLDAITDRIESGLDARGPSGLIEGLSRRVDEIHASLRSQLAESAVDTRPLEGLVRGLSDRIGLASDATADFHQLEAAVRDAAARIDGAAAGLDTRGVQALETQLARLAERLDRSEASLRTLDGVEHTLGELFSQFEVTRQVAIDAAETAARTAARDTLRAALQSPALVHRASDVPSAAVDQMARSLDDIRALQDTSERRTQSALSDIQIAMDRLTQQMAGAPGRFSPLDEPRRARAAPEPAMEAARVALDPADHLIEPGLGRGFDLRPASPEPRGEAEAEGQAPTPAVESDGPASFIAAARRAAQAAQASAASTAAARAADRHPAASRGRGVFAAADGGTLGRARLSWRIAAARSCSASPPWCCSSARSRS